MCALQIAVMGKMLAELFKRSVAQGNGCCLAFTILISCQAY